MRKQQASCLLSCNRDAVTRTVLPSRLPDTAGRCAQELKEDDCVWSGDNCEACRAGTKAVLEARATITSDSVKDIEVDRSAN